MRKNCLIVFFCMGLVFLCASGVYADEPPPDEQVVSPSSGFFDVLISWMYTVATWILNGFIVVLKWALYLFFRIACQAILIAMSWVIGLIPDSYAASLTPLLGWVPVVNAWIPLDVIVPAFLAYIAFKIQFILFRAVINFAKGFT